MKKILLLLLSMSALACRAEDLYHFIKEIPVGGEGGWDYLTVDSAAQRLYVSHATKVVALDLANDAIAGEIPDMTGVHGIALAPELNRGLVTCGRENKAAIIDLKSLQTLAKVDTGVNPDGMLYQPTQQEFYTFNGRGESATVINAKSLKVVATIALGGKPEFPQTDADTGLVYDNLEDKSEVVAIDAKTHDVESHWPIAPGEEASGMAIDAKNHRLFIGCHNKLMVMMDDRTGKVLATTPIGDGVDANAYDSETHLAFASCADGTVTIAREEGDSLKGVQTLKTETGARTLALDPGTHKIYLGSAKFEAPVEGERRRKIVSGSFKILVYGMTITSAGKN